MPRSADQLRRDAVQIWQAGVDAVRSDRLVQEALQVQDGLLRIGDEHFPLAELERIAVVGAGKAGAGMAAGVEAALGPEVLRAKQVTGWINVPADCLRPLDTLHLHPARPPGVNEPTPEGVAGSEAMLRLVGSLGPHDLCLVLISGGASALLPAPVEGISLEDKLAVTRHLSAAGANIRELNIVRKQLSRIKGGGLLRACRAGWLVTLVISDVIGDPLEVIGSGPTMEDTSTPEEALAVLQRFAARDAGIRAAVFDYLESRRGLGRPGPRRGGPKVRHLVIGNNATAVEAAGMEAVRLGYSPAMTAATELEGEAEELGRHLAEMALRMRQQPGPDALVSGGEPVVKLAPAAERGRGGRNQQLVLAAFERLQGNVQGMAILSAGTDGEDGPTDAAGAIIDASIAAEARRQTLDPAEFLRRNDAWHFFEPIGGLLKTGPTHTNVCDLRIVVVEREEIVPRP